MRPSSLAFRLVASAALWCALVLGAGGIGLSMLLADTVQRNFDARLGVLLEALVAGSELDENGAFVLRLQLGEPRFAQPLSGWYWQIEPAGPETPAEPLGRSASLWDQTLELDLPTGQSLARADVVGPAGQPLRLLVRAISLPGADRPFLYGVAGDRREISQQTARFNQLLVFWLGVLLLGLLVAVFAQVRFGLEPLRRMGRALAAIRTGEKRRMEGEFASELQPLAQELNALLDHSEALVERARTHVGNLAHGLKTPLAVLTNEANRSDGPLAALTLRQVAIMRDQVEHHLARARTAATAGVLGARTDVAPVVADLARTLQRIHATHQVAIEARCPESLAFRGARQDLEEMLGNLLDNACKWARAKVAISATGEDGRIVVRVEDDGPGLPAEERARVLERGRRLDERVPGSGLGLAIVADLAETYGGSVVLDTAPLGGLLARLTLPAAASTPAPKS